MSLKHILFSAFPAWGHIRPFCVLAARLVKGGPGIIVTMIIGPQFLGLAQSEIASEFGDEVLDDARRRLRILSTTTLFQSENLMGAMTALIETYATAYEALAHGKSIACAAEGTVFDAVPAPVIVVLDFITLPQLQATRTITGRTVPIMAWVTGHMSSMARWFLPESAGGIGDLGSKIDAEVARTGGSPEDIGEKLYKQTEGRVVKAIGLPDMYDYEFFPQTLPFNVPMSMFVRAAHQFMAECDGAMVASAYAIENEILSVLKSGLPDWNKETYIVGPLVPTRHGIVSSAPGEEDVQDFLNEKLHKYGENSVLLISFGTAFWTSVPEYLEEIIDVLIEKKFPFICSMASPVSRVNPKTIDKLNASGLGLMKEWMPQKYILNHRATGWLLTHCGQSSVTEALAAGVPMIAWPFDADQPGAAAYLSENLHVAFELIEVRTGAAGTRPLLRNGQAPKGGRDAVGAEFRRVIDDFRSPKGFNMRSKAEEIGRKFTEAWQENGTSRQELQAFLSKYVYT